MEVAPAWIMTLSYELEVRTKVYDLVVSDGNARADLKTCHDHNLVTIHLVTPVTLATTTAPTQPAFRFARIKKKPRPTRKKIPCSTKRRLFDAAGRCKVSHFPGNDAGRSWTSTMPSLVTIAHIECVRSTHTIQLARTASSTTIAWRQLATF